jgi:hypothetical protein
MRPKSNARNMRNVAQLDATNRNQTQYDRPDSADLPRKYLKYKRPIMAPTALGDWVSEVQILFPRQF